MTSIQHRLDVLCAKLGEARRNAPPNALCHRIGPPLTVAEIEARCGIPIEPWRRTDAPPTPSQRKRKPNITTLNKRARKAGERGPVRVELVNVDGTSTIITFGGEHAPEAMTEDEAEKLWHERISKNAAH